MKEKIKRNKIQEEFIKNELEDCPEEFNKVFIDNMSDILATDDKEISNDFSKDKDYKGGKLMYNLRSRQEDYIIDDVVLVLLEDLTLHIMQIDSIYGNECAVTDILTGVLYSIIHCNQIITKLSYDDVEISLDYFESEGIRFTYNFGD